MKFAVPYMFVTEDGCTPFIMIVKGESPLGAAVTCKINLRKDLTRIYIIEEEADKKA